MTSEQCPATTRHTPLHSLETFGLQCHFTKGHDGDHCANFGIGKGDMFWPQQAADDASPSEEDSIRKLMTEAQANPGQVITR